jgi:uncharacterized Zn finger protein
VGAEVHGVQEQAREGGEAKMTQGDRMTEYCPPCNRDSRFAVMRRRGNAIFANCMTCGYVLVGSFKAVSA